MMRIRAQGEGIGGESRGVARSTTAKFLIVLGCLGVLTVLQTLVLRRETKANRSIAAVINASGRQRMLTQRAVMLGQRLVTAGDAAERELLREDLGELADVLLATHTSLAEGNGERGIPSARPARLTALYFEPPVRLDARVRGFIASVHKLVNAPEEDLASDNPDLRRIYADASGFLLSSLDEAVSIYEESAREGIDRLRRLQYALGGVFLVVLLLLWITVFGPLVRTLREKWEALELLNRTLEERVEERSSAATRRAEQLARSESTLRDQARLLRAVVESMSEALLVTDRSGRIILANSAAERTYGPRRATLGEWLGRLAFLNSDGKSRWALEDLPISRTIRDGQPATVPELLLKVEETSPAVWLSPNSRPLRSEEGVLIGALCVTRDITAQKSVEAQLRHAVKMEAVGKLTGGLAHDLNNLLTVIIGNLELLKARVEPDEEFDELWGEARAGTQRAARLIKRLLAFSRRQTLQPQVTDVNALLLGMAELIRGTLGEAIDVEAIAAGGLWKVVVDPHELESVLLNLVVNARDAMPTGGKLTIETANTRLDNEYAKGHHEVKAGQFVMLAVTDTGSGIPPDALDRVFEPFFTTKEAGEGTGLGLSMAYGFVKQSGGHIKAYSEPGRGTSLKVYLPRARDGASREPPKARSVGPVCGGNETVLVVEDDSRVRKVAVAVLAGLGYRVLEAAEGAEALAVLARHPEIDALFTDVVLPGGMNGGDLAREMARRRPGIKVLFASGYTENAVVHEGTLEPGTHLLDKPYQRSDLAQALRVVLDEEAES